jgi:preprotein translocase subunit SecA
MRIFAPEWTIKALSLIGWEEGEPIYHSRISKGIEKAQKKVEERNFEQRKSLLEYDEVMDYQRKIFYSRRRKILKGEGLKGIIEEMIDDVIAKSKETILSDDYPVRCICEWARGNFGVDMEPGQVKGLNVDEIEHQVKLEALRNASNEIEITLGEYLEDYDDRKSWNIDGLCKWAMSRFSAGLTAGKLRHMDFEQIQETVNEAVKEQINSRDCSQLGEFVKDDYALRTFAQWASLKFDIKDFTAEKLQGRDRGEIVKALKDAVAEKYKQRQIEYPVEFAMNMAYGRQGAGIYGFEALSQWAKKKYDAQMEPERLQEMKPGDVQKALLDLSRVYFNGKLTEVIESKFASETDTERIASWANDRFDADIEPDSVQGQGSLKDKVILAGERFMRKELCDLEKYVLVQIYDTAWKDHLYAMDHLKEGIFLRAFAEKDPRIEYKQEGFRMFNEMLDQIEDKVTDTIFKVRLDAGTRTKSVWNVSSSSHDQVDQFAMAERQRAAATAPQKTDKPKQIVKQTPKVGRNDPCPCGSGRKYKKCCGQVA